MNPVHQETLNRLYRDYKKGRLTYDDYVLLTKSVELNATAQDRTSKHGRP